MANSDSTTPDCRYCGDGNSRACELCTYLTVNPQHTAKLITVDGGGVFLVAKFESSNVSRAGYREGAMLVCFRGGGWGVYERVPRSMWAEFISAESKGSFVARRLRGHDEYPYRGEVMLREEDVPVYRYNVDSECHAAVDEQWILTSLDNIDVDEVKARFVDRIYSDANSGIEFVAEHVHNEEGRTVTKVQKAEAK